MTDKTSGGLSPNTNIVNALNQISLQIAQLTKIMDTVFPTAIGTSGSATAGAIAPTNFVGYLSVINPATGAEVKVPYYSP